MDYVKKLREKLDRYKLDSTEDSGESNIREKLAEVRRNNPPHTTTVEQPKKADSTFPLTADSKKRGLTSEQQSAIDRAVEAVVDRNKNKSVNNLSYEQQNEQLKNQIKKARKEKYNSAFEIVLNKMSGESTDSAERRYESAKRKHSSLKEYKWDEAQKYNQSQLDENTELSELVKKAYESKLLTDSTKNNNQGAQNNPLADLIFPASNQSNQYVSDYQKYMKQIEEMGYDANSLLDTYTRNSNQKLTEQIEDKTGDFADKHPVIASGAHVALNAFQAPAMEDVVRTGLQSAISDEYIPIDTNAPTFAATNARDAISGQVTGDIQQKVIDKTENETLANTAGFLYQTGLSIGDFASVAALPQPASLAIMGTSAAVSTAKDATQRGISADKAALTAIAAGASEIIFEKLSLENLNALKTTGRSGVVNTVKDILKQTFTEGSEEVFTDIANAISDQIINGDNSAIMQNYQKLIDAGMTEEEARKQTAIGFGKQIGESFLGGAISGGIIGAGGVAYGNIAQNNYYSTVGSEIKQYGNAQEVINTGLEADPHSKTYQAAMELQERLDRAAYEGNTESPDYSVLSNKKLGKLQLANENLGSQTNLINAVADSENTPLTAVAKFAAGEELSDNDVTAIKSNPDAIRAINQEYGTNLTADNISKFELNQLSDTVSKNVAYPFKRNASAESESAVSYNIPATDKFGKPVDITDIEVEQGNVVVTTSDNGKINSQELNFQNRETTELFERAASYPTNAAKSFIAGYDYASQQSVTDYAIAFSDIYLDTARSKTTGGMNAETAIAMGADRNLAPQQAYLAYAAAENEFINGYNEKYMSAKNKATVKAKFEAAIKSDTIGASVIGTPKTSMQNAEIALLDEVAKHNNLSVIVVDSLQDVVDKDSNAAAVNGKIVIGLDTQNGMLLPYAGHELFHILKQNKNSSATAKELQAFIIDVLKNDAAYNYGERFNELQSAYKFKGTDAEIADMINEEIAANACFTVLSKEQNFKSLVNQNKSLAQRVYDFFADFLNQIRERLVTLAKQNKEYRVLQQPQNLPAQDKIVSMMKTALSEYKNNNTVQNDNVKYSLTEDFDDNTDFTENINNVVNMDSVCDMKGSEFAKGKTDLITQVSNFFDSLGNIVHSKYGDVVLNRTGVKSSLGHGIGRNKAVAFTAVPDVIEHGEIVDYHVNHKGRGYDTAVIAAPVTIDKTPYYMATVIVVEKNKNSYYLHEVALQKKEDGTPFKTGTVKNNGTPSGATSSIYSLLEKLQNVNNNSMQKIDKNNTVQNDSVKYALKPYSEKQIKNWSASKNIVLYINENQFKEFCNQALNSNDFKKKIYFGAVTSELADKIKIETGIDTENLNCCIRADEVRKILKNSHGNEANENLRGQRAITINDLMSIPYILQNADEIRKSDKLYEGKPAIEFVKSFNGKTTVISYVSKKHNDLSVQTMYASKKNRSLATTPSGDNSFSHTSKTLSGTTSINTVSQTDTDVNNNSMQKIDKNNTVQNDSVIKLSRKINEPLHSYVEKILNMSDEQAKQLKADDTYISIMSNTPKVIIDNISDAQNLEVLMRFDSFYLETRNQGVLEGNYHNLGLQMAELPKYISDPDAIIRNDKGRLNLITAISDNNNRLISIELNTVKDINSKNTKYNLVVSVFNSKNRYVDNLIKKAVSLEYERKDLSQVNHQLHKSLATINDKSSNTTVSQTDTDVNNNSMQKIDKNNTSTNSSVASTGIKFSKKISEYPYNMQTVIKDYLNSVDNDIVIFVNDARLETNKKRLEYMHRDIEISNRDILNEISQIVNLDVSKFKTRINGEAIKHIEKRHGANGAHDHSMKDANDIARVAYIFNNADNIEQTINSQGNIVYSEQYRTKDNKPSPVITISKKINGTYYIALAVPDSKKKCMHIESLFISNKKESVQEFDDNIPKLTPEASLESDSTNTVSQTDTDVNNNFTQNNSKYSLRDSDGNELTKQQQEYFKDSKVRDDEGNLLVVYHGTDAEFTVFDRTKARANMDIQGIFFSPWEIDAQGYGTAVNKYYINIANPANEGTAYKALNKFKGQNNAGIKARELLISLGYDGVNNSGEEYIAFYPEQIKLIDNENPTDNEDIRFSLRESNKDVEKLLKENAQLQDANELLRQELQLTKGHRLNPNNINSIAKSLIKKYGAYELDEQILQDSLSSLYNYMANAGSMIDDGYIWSVANDIAKNIIKVSTVRDTEFYNEYKDLKKRLRETAITVPADVRKEVAEYANINKLRIRNKGIISLDSFYNELAADYPELFDNTVLAEADQLSRIIEVYESIAPIYTDRLSQSGYTLEEYSSIVAAEIFDKYFNVKEMPTFADKKQRELEQLKLHYSNTIDSMKKQYQRQYQEREAQLQAKLKNANARNRQKLIKQQAHFTEMSLNAFHRKRRTVAKNKIANVKKDLTRRLLNPTETSFVPMSLVQKIADICDLINETQIKDKNNFDRSQNIIHELQSLHSAYEELKTYPDVDYASEYEQEMGTRISLLKNMLEQSIADSDNGTLQVAQLDYPQLEDIYHILRDIKNALVDATYQIGLDERISNHQRGVKIINELNETKGWRNTHIGRYEMETLNPVRAARKITEYNDDAELYKMVNELNLGQRKADKFISDASKPFYDLRQQAKEFTRFSSVEVETSIVDKNGNKVRMTENEIVQLIMTMKRRQGKNHLKEKGFILPDRKLLKKGKQKNALAQGTVIERLNPYEVYKMYDGLSDYAKAWMSASQYLFNEQGKNAINETSMLLKHKKIATAENYIPIQVDTDFTSKEIQGLKFDGTIEGMGSLKSVVEKANQPLIIQGLNIVVDKHINDVSKYYGLAIPIRNFNKVFGVQTSDAHDVQLGRNTVRVALRTKWGDAGLKLFDNLITDLQTSRSTGGKSMASEILDKVQSGFVQATLASNISVTIKQAASYPTALANLSGKSLGAGLPVFAYKSKQLDKLFAEIDEHTGIHFKRRIGMSSQELGELTKENAFINKIPAIINPMKWIQATDVKTTAALWVAAKYEVKKLYPDIKVNSEEYFEKVTSLYEETIENTQPNYDVLHRSEVQKEKGIMRSIAMFKTQPLQNTGILYDSLFEYRQKHSEYNKNKTDENKSALEQAQRKFRKAVNSQFWATVTFSAMSMLAAMIRHTMYGYRDDDDEVTWKSIVSGLMNSMANLFFTLLAPIGGGELYEGIKSLGDGYSSDFVSVPVVTTINDLWSSISKVVKTANGVVDGEKEIKDLLSSVENLGYSVATVLGIPAKNAVNYSKGIIENIKDAVNGEFGKFENEFNLWNFKFEKRDRKPKQNADRYGKYFSGDGYKKDDVKAKEILNEMISDKKEEYLAAGKTADEAEKEARSSVRDSFSSHYKKLYQDAFKKGDGNTRSQIYNILNSTGLFVYENKTLIDVIDDWEKEITQKKNKK